MTTNKVTQRRLGQEWADLAHQHGKTTVHVLRTPMMEAAPHTEDSDHAPQPGTPAPGLPTAAPAPDQVTSTLSPPALEPQLGTLTPAIAPQLGRQERRQATAAKTPVATMPPLPVAFTLHLLQAHTAAPRLLVLRRPRPELGLIVPRPRERSTPLPPVARLKSRTMPLHLRPGTVVRMMRPHPRWEMVTMRAHGMKKEHLVPKLSFFGAGVVTGEIK
jgi:hypothetical protein